VVETPRLLIAGGYGVFGRLLARELLDHTRARLLIGGRDRVRAAELCTALGAGERVEPLRLDLTDPAAAAAARGCFALLCTAGPFQRLPRQLPRQVVAVGAHWLDLADARDWVGPLLADPELGPAAAAAGAAVLPGLSTVPTLSGVLARWLAARLPNARRARLTLFIGNRNAKGAGAIGSSLEAGFLDAAAVTLPIGRYLADRYASPDEELLGAELGLVAEFRVALEWALGRRLMAAAAPLHRRLSPRGKARLGRLLALLAAPASRFGTDRGCLQAELWDDCGRCATAALTGAGQRMAILPCALTAEALLSGELAARGVVRPVTWLSPEDWLERLQRRGLEFRAEA
jgi:hypothetical protein